MNHFKDTFKIDISKLTKAQRKRLYDIFIKHDCLCSEEVLNYTNKAIYYNSDKVIRGTNLKYFKSGINKFKIITYRDLFLKIQNKLK